MITDGPSIVTIGQWRVKIGWKQKLNGSSKECMKNFGG